MHIKLSEMFKAYIMTIFPNKNYIDELEDKKVAFLMLAPAFRVLMFRNSFENFKPLDHRFQKTYLLENVYYVR